MVMASSENTVFNIQIKEFIKRLDSMIVNNMWCRQFNSRHSIKFNKRFALDLHHLMDRRLIREEIKPKTTFRYSVILASIKQFSKHQVCTYKILHSALLSNPFKT